jgi:hypothetical protein
MAALERVGHVVSLVDISIFVDGRTVSGRRHIMRCWLLRSSLRTGVVPRKARISSILLSILIPRLASLTP